MMKQAIGQGAADALVEEDKHGRDLQLLQRVDYDGLTEKTTEVKRMLTGLLQKLKAAG